MGIILTLFSMPDSSDLDSSNFFVPNQFSTLHSFSDFSDLTPDAFSEMVLHLMESSGVVRDKKGFLHSSDYTYIKDVQFPKYSFLVRCIKESKSHQVEASDIELFVSDIERQGLSAGIFLSILPFSKEAQETAQESNILCIGKNALGVMMRKINTTFEHLLDKEDDIFSYLYNFTEEYKQKRNIFYQDISEILKSDIGEVLFDTHYKAQISPQKGLILKSVRRKSSERSKFVRLSVFASIVIVMGIIIVGGTGMLESRDLLASLL